MFPQSKGSPGCGERGNEQNILLVDSAALPRRMDKQQTMEPEVNVMKNREVVSTATGLMEKLLLGCSN